MTMRAAAHAEFDGSLEAISPVSAKGESQKI